MKLNDFLAWLDTYLNFEKKQTKGIFWLESMRFLCDRLGNPQDKIQCFHIAGSKGKGSTSKMIASILESAGYKCGLYTSPHIKDFRERIGTASGFFDDDIYEKAAEKIVDCVNRINADELPGGRAFTWFELVTVYAFLCFEIAGVDYAVYEVGLGGRLDSTNIVRPLVSVITQIELEHTEFLGDTIEKIAGEKAGIIKEGIPVVIGHQKYDAALEKLVGSAKKYTNQYIISDVIITFQDVKFERSKMNVTFESKFFSRPLKCSLRLIGEAQIWNAKAALCAVKSALPEITEKAMEQGLSDAFLNARFEVRTPPRSFPNIQCLVLDGAHTVNSISLVIKTIEECFPRQEFDLLFACAADKEVKDIAPLFLGKFFSVTLTRPGVVRQSDIASVEAAFENAGIDFEAIEDCSEAIKSALKKANEAGHALLITGSFYLIGCVTLLEP
ncbi:MAG: bifunctional folylpolyglutamate synthase/dihydrofolate synthase [Treponema sp.]|nr:bifunctional folylpolyglutamate synthase/dihydrofolate synthase [Treponema sp.]